MKKISLGHYKLVLKFRPIMVMVSLILISSCEDNTGITFTTYNKGQCLKEIDKSWVSTEGYTPRVYRVDKKHSDHYEISVYSFNRWIDLRDRELSYFKDTEKFSYELILCPGKKSKFRIPAELKKKKSK